MSRTKPSLCNWRKNEWFFPLGHIFRGKFLTQNVKNKFQSNSKTKIDFDNVFDDSKTKIDFDNVFDSIQVVFRIFLSVESQNQKFKNKPNFGLSLRNKYSLFMSRQMHVLWLKICTFYYDVNNIMLFVFFQTNSKKETFDSTEKVYLSKQMKWWLHYLFYFKVFSLQFDMLLSRA